MEDSKVSLSVLRGHTNIILSVAFSPDGRLLASGGLDRSVRVWDALSGACIHCLTGHRNNVGKVLFSPSAPILASGSHDHYVRVWDCDSGKLLSAMGPHGGALLGGVGPIAFSPDGRFLASPGGKSFRIWEMSKYQMIREITHSAGWTAGCDAVCYAPDGKTLFSVSRGHIHAWDTTTWKDRGQIGKYGTWADSSLSVSRDGRFLAATKWNPVTVWEIQTGKKVADIDLSCVLSFGAAFLCERDAILIAAESGVAIWDVLTAKKMKDLPVTEVVGAVAIDPGEQHVALGFVNGTIELRQLFAPRKTRNETKGPRKKAELRCPKCGFSYRYDGESCGHCGYTNSKAERTKEALSASGPSNEGAGTSTFKPPRESKLDSPTPRPDSALHTESPPAKKTLTVTCPKPSCRKKLRAPTEYAGRRAKCPACGGVITIPQLGDSHVAPAPQTTVPSESLQASGKDKGGPYKGLETCPHCNRRVLFQGDGSCPVCRVRRGGPVAGKKKATQQQPVVNQPAAQTVQKAETGSPSQQPKKGQGQSEKAVDEFKPWEAVVGCVVMLLVLVGIFFAGRWVYRSIWNGSPAVAERFDGWGIGFQPPEGWSRWTEGQELQAVEMLQGVMPAAGREVLHAVAWTSPDERAALLVGMYHDPSVESLSALLSDEEKKMDVERESGDVAKINKLRIEKAGTLEAVKCDIERNDGGRGVCYYFLSPPHVVSLLLVAQKSTEFKQHSPQLQHAAESFAFQEEVDREPAEPLSRDMLADAREDGPKVGFSEWERKILPWVLFFICSGLCAGGTQAGRKK